MIIKNLFHSKYPIVQAPMAGGITTPEFVAEVSNCGGIGSLGAAYMSPDDLRKAIHKIKQLTDKPFAVNLFAPEDNFVDYNRQIKMCKILNLVCDELHVKIEPVDEIYQLPFAENFEIIIEESVPIFSFTFGIPDETFLKRCRKKNIAIVGTATNLEEGKLLKDAQVDAIVAQGIEAGGHRGTFPNTKTPSQIGLISLIQQLVKQIDLPIIAAGGIGDHHGVKAALQLGALAVQIGTAFITTNESGAHSIYKKTLINTSFDNTILTKVFSGRLARGIRNKFIYEMEKYREIILPFPIQNKLTKQLRIEASQQGDARFMSLWAGQSAHLCQSIPVKKLIQELTS